MTSTVDPALTPTSLVVAGLENQDQGPETLEEKVDPSLVPFDFTLLIPRQSFAPIKNSSIPTDSQDPAFLALVLGITLNDVVNDLSQLVRDTPEGFWLGAFGMVPVVAKALDSLAADQVPEDETPAGESIPVNWGPWEALAPAPDELEGKSWRLNRHGVLGDFADLVNVFGGADWTGIKRGLKIVPTPYAGLDMSQHLLRVRNVSTVGTNAIYDPSSIAISPGTTLYASVRGDVTPPSPEPATADAPKGKKSKATATPVLPPTTPGPKTHAFTNWSINDLKPLQSFERFPTPASSNVTSPCFRSLALSPWGPPPHTWRIQGHSAYLIFSSIEGDTFHITGATAGFWVSKSSATHFDPTPKLVLPKGLHAGAYHSLFELFSALSPSFARGVVTLVEKNHPAGDLNHLYSTLPITHDIPAASWLVPTPVHSADPLRTQIAYLLTHATTADLLPPARDWNDEFCQFRELPTSTLAERLMRERLLSRMQADYVGAATQGALAIARGEIPPLNPLEPEAAHTFLHNNMLFTRSEDAIQAYAHVGGDEASKITALKDLRGVGLLERLDLPDLYTMATVIVDFCGERWVVQSVIPGLFKTKAHEEAAPTADDKPVPSKETVSQDDYPPSGHFRIVYGSANPEVPDDKVRSSPYFATLAKQVGEALHLAQHTVYDAHARESRLWLSTDLHGIAGPDGRSYAIDCSRLHCVDVEFLENNLGGSVTATSGIADPLGSTNEDTFPHITVNYPHRMVLLRPELLQAYRDSKLQKWIEEKVLATRDALSAETDTAIAISKSGSDDSSPRTVIDADDFKLSFNPDAFVEREPSTDGSKTIIIFDADEASTLEVRYASRWLREVALPNFIIDAVLATVGYFDGFFLTKLMHRKGINVRYLGLLAQAVERDSAKYDFGKNISADDIAFGLRGFKTCLQTEMVSRAAKHLLGRLLRATASSSHPHVIAHFFNCLLGAALEPAPIAARAPTSGGDVAWVHLTPLILQAQVVTEVQSRYRYTLPASIFISLPSIRLLREICLRVGIQLHLRPYSFIPATIPTLATPTPINSDAKNNKRAKAIKPPAEVQNGTPLQTLSFGPEDVLNILPVVKSNPFKSTIAEEAFQAGRQALAEGHFDLANEVISDALSLYEQVFGSVHSEPASKFHTLAILYHNLSGNLGRRIELHESSQAAYNEMPADAQAEALPRLQEVLLPDLERTKLEAESFIQTAVTLVQRAIIASERVNGLETSETIQMYSDLGVLESAIGNPDAALRFLKHAIELFATHYGPRHPSILNLLSNATQIIQSAYDLPSSLSLLGQCREFAEAVYGAESVQYATAIFHLSQTVGFCGDLGGSLQLAQVALVIFTDKLGVESKETADAAAFVQVLVTAFGDAENRRAEARRLEAAVAAVPVVERIRNSANQARLRKKFPGIGASAAAAVATAVESKAHGEKAGMSVDELEKYINSSASARGPNRKHKADV